MQVRCCILLYMQCCCVGVDAGLNERTRGHILGIMVAKVQKKASSAIFYEESKDIQADHRLPFP